ncbi:MurR/RpiR family transcriptional regulator [Microvirga roseola]|uniref:MurR/RpiR family transcriptional regulator n=1 Tax=Microvirga roseola TaxID=2883126 RepID=UPI001E368CC5|nr:MurR/RpiR family transcriptional regulator [Microvirga roseola]
MDSAPLAAKIAETFAGLPAQLQAAARFILERPGDVALLSMRDQARQAGVQPATMTRLAQRLGFDGYDAIRELYAQAIRENRLGFLGKASAQVATQKARGEQALAAEIAATLQAQIGRLGEPAQLERLVSAAALLDAAERIYCLGLRSSHPVAWQMSYVISLLGRKAVLLDTAAGIGTDPIRNATPHDVLFAVSIAPYTRATVEAVQYAKSRNVPVVTVTDSAASPLAQAAQSAILVSTDSPSFFHSMTPAFMVGEILAALVAGRGGEASLNALRRTEDQLTAFNIHWSPKDGRRTS